MILIWRAEENLMMKNKDNTEYLYTECKYGGPLGRRPERVT